MHGKGTNKAVICHYLAPVYNVNVAKSQAFTSLPLTLFAIQQDPKSQESSVTFSIAEKASVLASFIQCSG